MTITADWQMQFQGLLMGAGQPHRVVSWEGLADHPDVRSSDQTRLRRHGMLPGDDFAGGRSIIVPLEVQGGTLANMSMLMDALKLALRVGEAESPLQFQVPGVAGGGLRRVNARARRLASVVDQRYSTGKQPNPVVEFFATDPRIYDDTPQSLQTGLVASVAGLTWNLTWNLNWGGAATSNSVFAVNAGTFSTPLQVRFDGPVTNPKVENVTTGQYLAFSADSGLVLGAGEFLIVDTDTRTILLGGTSSRYSKLTSDSQWFDLAPGTTQLRFSGTTAGAPTMTVTFRSAWL